MYVYEPFTTMETFNSLFKQMLPFLQDELLSKMKKYMPVDLATASHDCPTKSTTHKFILDEQYSSDRSIHSMKFAHFPIGKGYLVSPTETLPLIYNPPRPKYGELTHFIVEKLDNRYMFVGYHKDNDISRCYYEIIFKISDDFDDDFGTYEYIQVYA